MRYKINWKRFKTLPPQEWRNFFGCLILLILLLPVFAACKVYCILYTKVFGPIYDFIEDKII